MFGLLTDRDNKSRVILDYSDRKLKNLKYFFKILNIIPTVILIWTLKIEFY